MKATLFLAAAAGLVSLVSGQCFAAVASRSGSPIHLQEINANSESLWVGGTTGSLCPKAVKKQGGKCPPGKHTNFAGGQGSLSLCAEVPGGQQVYVERETGAVKYTIAHSADTDGGIVSGWNRTFTDGESVDTLSFSNGLLACPVGQSENGVWQIFAQLKGVSHVETCLSFGIVTSNQTKSAAWEYT